MLLVRIAASLLLVLSAAASAAAPAAIAWLPTADQALEVARSRHCPVFIAINMDNERANDLMVREHYRDATILKLAEKTACLFASRFDHASGDKPCPRCGGITCAQHMAIDKEVRRRWVEQAGDGSVIAPQHVFLDQEGKVILSVPYQITVGELEWCFVAAIRKLDPDFPWTLSAKARAPRRLVMEGVVDSKGDRLEQKPDKKELEEIFARLRTTGRGEASGDTRADVARLLISDDKRAIEYVESLLNSRYISGGGGRGRFGGGGDGGNRLTRMIHDIGRSSPPVWWEVVASFLDDHRLDVRREAAVALEQLREPKSLSDVMKQYKKEKELDAKKEQIRAIAAIGADSSKAIKLVVDTARKAKDELLRINAMVGAAALEDRAAVLDLVKPALAADVGGMRAAAAYVIAVRRELELKQDLEQAALLEADPDVKDAMERALAVLAGGEATQLEPVLRQFAKSDIVRDRL